MKKNVTIEILAYLADHPGISSKEVHETLESEVSYATVKRVLTRLEADKLIIAEGQGKATRYSISPIRRLLSPFDMETYFKTEIDQRDIKGNYNFELVPLLKGIDLFTDAELTKLNNLQERFNANISKLDETTYKKEM